MSGDKNDSDWFDDFMVMKMIEEEDSSENTSFSGGKSSSRNTSSSGRASGDIGCSTIFIVLAAIYIILQLYAS